MRPLGELGAAYRPSEWGLGQDDGYEAGFALRIPVNETWTWSPGFHFVDFGRHELVDASENAWRTEALSYRTTAELMWSPPVPASPLRPLLAVGAGLYRNRVTGYYDDVSIEERDDTVNSFGWYLRWGVRNDAVEVSCLVHRNEVKTWRWFESDRRGTYGWNNLAVRIGYRLPW